MSTHFLSLHDLLLDSCSSPYVTVATSTLLVFSCSAVDCRSRRRPVTAKPSARWPLTARPSTLFSSLGIYGHRCLVAAAAWRPVTVRSLLGTCSMGALLIWQSHPSLDSHPSHPVAPGCQVLPAPDKRLSGCSDAYSRTGCIEKNFAPELTPVPSPTPSSFHNRAYAKGTCSSDTRSSWCFTCKSSNRNTRWRTCW